VRSSENQFSDLNATRAKFDRQVAAFDKHAVSYRREGIVCLGIVFPIFEFCFLAKETQFSLNMNIHVPECGKVVNTQVGVHRQLPQYLFSIRLDYSNFDAVPPSLRIISPFNSELVSEVGFMPFISPGQQNPNAPLAKSFEHTNQNILLKDNEDKLFICLRGVKEYHAHPQHSGDSWFLYRKSGKGDILTILDQLQIYAISNFNALVDQQKKIPFPNG
jgi:hypothetical protein